MIIMQTSKTRKKQQQQVANHKEKKMTEWVRCRMWRKVKYRSRKILQKEKKRKVWERNCARKKSSQQKLSFFRINIYSRASITIPISWLYLISDVYVRLCFAVCLRAWFCMLHLNILRRRNTHSTLMSLSIKLYLLSSWSSVYYIDDTIDWWLFDSTWVALRRCTHACMCCALDEY